MSLLGFICLNTWLSTRGTVLGGWGGVPCWLKHVTRSRLWGCKEAEPRPSLSACDWGCKLCFLLHSHVYCLLPHYLAIVSFFPSGLWNLNIFFLPKVVLAMVFPHSHKWREQVSGTKILTTITKESWGSAIEREGEFTLSSLSFRGSEGWVMSLSLLVGLLSSMNWIKCY